jgi:hypothetical protein
MLQAIEQSIYRLAATASTPRRLTLTARWEGFAGPSICRAPIRATPFFLRHFFVHNRTSPLLLVRCTRALVLPVLKVKCLPGP